MSRWHVEDLPWLQAPPRNFRAMCKEASTHEQPGEELVRLAGYAMGAPQLGTLAKVSATLREDGKHSLEGVTLALLSNATVSLFAPALVGSALRFGIDLNLVEVGYGQVMQEVSNPDSEIYVAKPKAVLLALDARAYAFSSGFKVGGDAGGAVEQAMLFLNQLREKIREHSDATIIVQNLSPAHPSMFGSLDRRIAWTQKSITDTFNTRLIKELEGSADILFDICSLAEKVGVQNWLNPTQWHMAKLPFSQEMAPLYGEYLGRILAALQGKSRKCLVLDLDNTLWGGVIGDDGLEGIRIGQGDPVGEAYQEFQNVILALRERGIVLAVVSKNEEETAKEVFRKHPDMVVKEDHVAVFQANWVDKAANLKAIAEVLNLGLDSFVFVDDNPFERNQVRGELPMVAVPELPDDPAYYASALLDAGYFESILFTEDDARRSDQYNANARRVELKKHSASLDDYLASLGMELVVGPFDTLSRGRVAQLIGRSNQFNLTTKRYSEEEIKAMEQDDGIVTFQARLGDVFGDNGIIAVLICLKEGTTWSIDSWLMSCRVLNRKVENTLLNLLVAVARSNGVERLLGRYLPTRKNGLVKEHYANLGFHLVHEENGATEWELDLHCHEMQEVPVVCHYVDKS